jgi:hypothetical protein
MYSFGVIVLEIVTGRRNNRSLEDAASRSLLSYVRSLHTCLTSVPLYQVFNTYYALEGVAYSVQDTPCGSAGMGDVEHRVRGRAGGSFPGQTVPRERGALLRTDRATVRPGESER